MNKPPNILVYGYGNPGRQDDGLGVKLSEKIEKWAKTKKYDFIQADCNYQLNIEDASTINNYDLVVFADASREIIDDVMMTELSPDHTVDFTMHHVAPSYILYLCNEINNRIPLTYLLHIKGYEWEFLSEMTEKANENLNKALKFLQDFLTNYISDCFISKNSKCQYKP